MEKMLRDIDTMVEYWIDSFLFIFNEYRETCSRTDIASYIVKTVSDYVFEIADELDKADEEEEW